MGFRRHGLGGESGEVREIGLYTDRLGSFVFPLSEGGWFLFVYFSFLVLLLFKILV